MNRMANIISFLDKDQEFQKIQEGKDEYSNFTNRQKGLVRVIVNYLQHIEESSLCEIGSREYVISEIKRIFEIIIKCCKSFLSGDITNAINMLFDCYFKEGASLLNIKHINEGGIFFRMRKACNYHLYSKEEMFHIPFEKNYLIKTLI